MRICTNLPQLYKIQKYYNNCIYKPTNLHTLCEDNPDIIICKETDKEEGLAVFQSYPQVIVCGKGFHRPLVDVDIPEALLDKNLILESERNIGVKKWSLNRKAFEVGYIVRGNPSSYINKIQNLSNLKLMGPVINIDTIYEKVESEKIYAFYKLSKICFVDNLEHALIADRKSTRLNSSHVSESRMPSSA